jgi:hypothetical protein
VLTEPHSGGRPTSKPGSGAIGRFALVFGELITRGLPAKAAEELVSHVGCVLARPGHKILPRDRHALPEVMLVL